MINAAGRTSAWAKLSHHYRHTSAFG